jgi:hypothetical protein
MEWMNIRVSTIRSPDYMGSNPTERATWINVFAYCVEQENGGRIIGGADWKDRQWQQCCGVTAREVRSASKLIRVEGEDVVIQGYPAEKEIEVRARRNIAAEASKKRWANKITAPSSNPSPSPSCIPSCIPSGNASVNAELEGEREGEGEVHESHPSGMPKTEEEAVKLAGLLLIPHDFIKQRFHACMSVGFVDGAGRIIKSWPHYLQSSFIAAKQRDADKKKGPSYEAPLKYV